MIEIENNISNDYSYTFFKEFEKTIDKNIKKLPEDTIKIVEELKVKLKINDTKKDTQIERIKKKPEPLHEIYKLLNKITEKTYEKLSVEIIDIIGQLNENQSTSSEFIYKKTFEIVSNSSINSKLYARLYNDMIKKHSYFKQLFNENLKIYLDNFKKIDYVPPNEDYDKFCMYIKHIENMKNFTLFMIQCMYFSICDLDYIIDILLHFQERSLETLHLEEHIIENEQIVDTLYLIIKEIIDFAMLHDKWQQIVDNHTKLHRFHGAGKNNKIRFKLMDIEECITKNK